MKVLLTHTIGITPFYRWGWNWKEITQWWRISTGRLLYLLWWRLVCYSQYVYIGRVCLGHTIHIPPWQTSAHCWEVPFQQGQPRSLSIELWKARLPHRKSHQKRTSCIFEDLAGTRSKGAKVIQHCTPQENQCRKNHLGCNTRLQTNTLNINQILVKQKENSTKNNQPFTPSWKGKKKDD